MKIMLISTPNMAIKRPQKPVERFSPLTPYEDMAFEFKSRTDACKPVKKEM
jgi:hypothetical protein